MNGAESENARLQAAAYVQAVDRQTRAAEENQRMLSAYLKDTQANIARAPEYSAEYIRAARHHDVLCIVLKELIRGAFRHGHSLYHQSDVQSAREYADAAYPPPKVHE